METWRIYRTYNKARYKGESGFSREASRRAQAEKGDSLSIANVVEF